MLAQTYEKITLPNDLVGLVEGRSSFARVGITAHVTAPKIDPGFDGTITLEMVNLGPLPVELKALELKPCQLMLMTLSSPCAEGEVYGSSPTHIFQHQDKPLPTS